MAFMITDKTNNVEGIVVDLDEGKLQIEWSDERVEEFTEEELKALLQDENYSVEEVELVDGEEDETVNEETPAVGPDGQATPAQATIKAHSTADKAPGQEDDNNPKTRIDWIKQIVGGLGDIEDNALQQLAFQFTQAGRPDFSAPTDGDVDKNRATIVAKPSNAVGTGFIKTEQDKLFGETGLTEEAQGKISTLFEVAVQTAIVEESAKLQEQYDVAVNEAVEALSSNLEEKVGLFLDACVAEWLNENQIAIESKLRTELTMEFLDKLHGLFEESYIDIPEDKVDVLEAFVQKNEALEAKVNESLLKNIEKDKTIKELQKGLEVAKLSEGLTLPKKTQLAKLVETVEFTSVEDFGKKVTVIKEGFLKDKPAAVDTGILTETKEIAEDHIDGDKAITTAPAPTALDRLLRL